SFLVTSLPFVIVLYAQSKPPSPSFLYAVFDLAPLIKSNVIQPVSYWLLPSSSQSFQEIYYLFKNCLLMLLVMNNICLKIQLLTTCNYSVLTDGILISCAMTI